MKKLSIILSAIMGAMAIMCILVIGLRLSQETIELIGTSILVSILLMVAGLFCIAIPIAKQRYRIVRAMADKADLSSRLIDTSDGTWIVQAKTQNGSLEIAALHSNPLWEINGHREPATQAELLAWQAYNHRGSANDIKGLSSGIVIDNPPQPQMELLPILLRAERAIIKGKSDAGKTTLLLSLAMQSNGVIAIDPHNYPDKWPSNCRVIGGGENFSEIDQYLSWLYQTMQERYEQMSKGEVKERQFNTLTLICDEVMSVVDECQDSKNIFRKLVTRGRKVNFCVYLGSHSELVKPLGLEGMGDIRDNFVFVRLYYSAITGKRSVTIDDGNGEIAANFPAYQLASGQPLKLPQLPAKINKESRIIEMIESGATDREIAQEIFDKPYLSGDNFYKVKLIRDSLPNK